MAPNRRGYHTFLSSPWHSMGQTMPDAVELRLNETATRARAGLLNLLSITTIFLLVAILGPDAVEATRAK